MHVWIVQIYLNGWFPMTIPPEYTRERARDRLRKLIRDVPGQSDCRHRIRKYVPEN